MYHKYTQQNQVTENIKKCKKAKMMSSAATVI